MIKICTYSCLHVRANQMHKWSQGENAKGCVRGWVNKNIQRLFLLQPLVQSCALAWPQTPLLLLLALPRFSLLSALLALLPHLCLDLLPGHLPVTIPCSSTSLKQSPEKFGVFILLCFIHWYYILSKNGLTNWSRAMMPIYLRVLLLLILNFGIISEISGMCFYFSTCKAIRSQAIFSNATVSLH